MKKAAIILIAAAVIWLGLDYHHKKINELGKNLILDAYYGNLLSVKEGLEKGAPLTYTLYLHDPDRGYGGVEFNALQAAASSGNEDIINFLLEQGLSIDEATPQGWTPLFIAIRDGRAEAAKLLIFRKANLNAQTDRGATPLLMALTQPFPTEKEREGLLLYMLKRGADVNWTDNFNNAPLYYAAVLKNARAAELLHEYGAAPDKQTKEKIKKLLAGKKDAASKKILQILKQKPKPAPKPED